MNGSYNNKHVHHYTFNARKTFGIQNKIKKLKTFAFETSLLELCKLDVIGTFWVSK
jgi:hypothetical protein